MTPFSNGNAHTNACDPTQAFAWVGDWSGRRATLSPDRTALIDATTEAEYTYADIERRAIKMAKLLAAYGVTDGERVTLVSRNRVEAFDCFFGTGKTGGVLAPLSHRLSTAEQASLLESVGPRLVVVESPFVDELEPALEMATLPTEPTRLELETDQPEGRWASVADRFDASNTAVSTRSNALTDPHLLLHTGGSTGTPKAATITHGSMLWNSINTITAWGIREDDIAPMVFPLFHTGGWNVLSVPLVHMGGTLVIDRTVDPGRVLGDIERHGATVFVAVPTVLRSMATHDRWDTTELSTLRFVKSGGGPCRESVIERWRERGVDLSQGYGLTEIGPNNFAMPDQWPTDAVKSVGKPVMHADVRIVDDEGTPLEAGEIGELEIRGPHAAAGYWEAVEDEHTFIGEWVSTGDLAHVDPEGFYHIDGRKKTMFVSGGENVYPAVVENAIAAHPAVAEVVVIGVPDERWGTVGKAVVEPATDWSPSDPEPFPLESLKLGETLAEYAIPKQLEFVEQLPTSGPDKIDRSAVEAQFRP